MVERRCRRVQRCCRCRGCAGAEVVQRWGTQVVQWWGLERWCKAEVVVPRCKGGEEVLWCRRGCAELVLVVQRWWCRGVVQSWWCRGVVQTDRAEVVQTW